MRVLLGMPDRNSLGGPAACEPPFVEGLRAAGVEVAEETYVYGESLKGTTSAERVARVLRTARALRRRLRGRRFDLVHLNTSFDARALLRDVPTLVALRGSGAKIFLKFHGSDAALFETKSAARRALRDALLARADGFGLLSSEERDNFARAGADAGRLFVVKNAVTLEGYERDAGFAARVRVPEGVPLLLFVARFIPAKGLLDVVRAVAVLRERGEECALLCLGDGPARAEAEAEVARLNLRERVRFFGYVPEREARDFYANSTALVFPTYHYEGFPMVVFNSLAAGLPVVTTRIRAAADYLREPDNCLWTPPRDPAALAEKISTLLSQTQLRATMNDNNRRLARRFDAEQVAREYVEVYRKILAGRAA
ncbi:MAG TPA: glycosyltransferase family 4 protein [Pyrinomonadaceae bacterium]|nr:glycosyltransferase family 4 protein [Pyrinomonadaceae bacterium]